MGSTVGATFSISRKPICTDEERFLGTQCLLADLTILRAAIGMKLGHRRVRPTTVHHSRNQYWLNGLAGTGKSTIARTVARRYFEQKRPGASFFFSRGSGDVSHAGKFVTSIAVQLANSVPTLHRIICKAITEHSDIPSRSLHDQ
jgi:hypothetical protein